MLAELEAQAETTGRLWARMAAGRARGMMARPKLLMIDELSLGLAPKVVDRLMDVIQQINKEGVAMILVEQDVLVALDAADRAYVLENGRIALSGGAADVRDDPGVRRAYLGL